MIRSCLRFLPAAVLLLAVGAIACGANPAIAAGPDSCADPTASYRPEATLPPPGEMPAGSYMRAILERGRLVAGASQDTLLFGFLNPMEDRIEGFDVDILRLVARAIFGTDEGHIQIHPVVSAQRIPLLHDGTVDIVAATMTINCERWQQIAFSTVYYHAGQRVLVSRNSNAHAIDDLGGKKVCAAAGSTSIANLKKASSKPIPVEVGAWTDCLVLFQTRQVDAISTDDVILKGLVAQDPYARVVGPKFTQEPYGLGISQDHPEFVRFVNGVLENARQDGTWAVIHHKWLGRFGESPEPPPAVYKD